MRREAERRKGLRESSHAALSGASGGRLRMRAPQLALPHCDPLRASHRRQHIHRQQAAHASRWQAGAQLCTDKPQTKKAAQAGAWAAKAGSLHQEYARTERRLCRMLQDQRIVKLMADQAAGW